MKAFEYKQIIEKRNSDVEIGIDQADISSYINLFDTAVSEALENNKKKFLFRILDLSDVCQKKLLQHLESGGWILRHNPISEDINPATGLSKYKIDVEVSCNIN